VLKGRLDVAGTDLALLREKYEEVSGVAGGVGVLEERIGRMEGDRKCSEIVLSEKNEIICGLQARGERAEVVERALSEKILECEKFKGLVGEMEGKLGEVQGCLRVSDEKVREVIPELSLQLKNAQSELVERHKEVMGLRHDLELLKNAKKDLEMSKILCLEAQKKLDLQEKETLTLRCNLVDEQKRRSDAEIECRQVAILESILKVTKEQSLSKTDEILASAKQ
jgi:prophage DNA circulation protein